MRNVIIFQLYFGGVPFMQEGMVVHENYTGCIENIYLNHTNFIQELKQSYEIGDTFRYNKINTAYSCPVSINKL